MRLYQKELSALADVLLKYPASLIATDDMYEHILWSDEAFQTSLMCCPQLYRAHDCFEWCLQGLLHDRLAYRLCGGPQPLIAAMKKIQSQSTSNPTSIAQVAATAAITAINHVLRPMLAAFRQRHDHVVKRLNAFHGVRCLPSHGTFYAFPDFSGAIAGCGKVNNDVEMAEYILNEVGVALVPGSAFGAEGYMRLSFATSMELLNEALDRLQKLLSGIRA